jgi:hypothetical protein
MHKRWCNYIVIAVIVLVVSCGESSSGDTSTDHAGRGDANRGSDSTATIPAAGSGVEAYPLTLTESDLADDTVFSDGSRPVSWENAGITKPVQLKIFIRRLQKWVHENQVDSIAAHLNYPLKNPGIKDARDFKLNYGTYFTDGVKSALGDQKLNQVFRTQQGVMIGQGQIWVQEKNNDFLIFAINN